jgi:ribosomal protein S18 acetylase RimI-like enzyme
MGIQIRHADDRDAQLISGFTRATLRELESNGGDLSNHDKAFWKKYAENIVGLIRKDDRLYLLAQTENSIVGFLEGNIFELPEVFAYKKRFHIRVVYVISESRKQGIASALAQEALRWACDRGCQEADLNVLFNNEKARNLYKKLGFNVFQYQLRIKLPANV